MTADFPVLSAGRAPGLTLDDSSISIDGTPGTQARSSRRELIASPADRFWERSGDHNHRASWRQQRDQDD
jgi:hypothetical protein